MHLLIAAACLAFVTVSANAAPSNPAPTSATQSPVSPAVSVPDEVAAAFEKTVKLRLNVPTDVTLAYLKLARERLTAQGAEISRAQFLTVVDRNSHVQAMLVYLVGVDGAYRLVGASPISTGGTGQFDHYVTPERVYDHTLTDFSDFRAEGSKNENGIRGYGAKGMRVWDFGWVAADKNWGRKKGEPGEIRFQLHATDADLLERRLGAPASKGCVRLSGSLNTFLDKYGALDWHYEQAQATGRRPWVLRKDQVKTPFAGRYLVVLDSEVTTAPAWKK